MVYFISDGQLIKIGYSKNVNKRIKQLSTGNGRKLFLLGTIDGDKNREKEIHKQFKSSNGEWFTVTDDLLSFINDSLCDRFVTWINDRLVSLLKIKK
jgi:hypothetical protein